MKNANPGKNSLTSNASAATAATGVSGTGSFVGPPANSAFNSMIQQSSSLQGT